MHSSFRLIYRGSLMLALLASCSPAPVEEEEERETSPTTSFSALTSAQTEEREFLKLKQTSRLVIYCAADLQDPVESAQWGILRAAVPALAADFVAKHVDGAGDAGKQLTQLQMVQRVKPTVLIVQPVAFKAISAMLTDIRQSGTIVLGLSEALSADSCDRQAHVDERAVGALAGQIVLQALMRKATAEGKSKVTGRVVQLTSSEDAAASELQSEGLQTALKAAPDVVIVHDAPAFWKKEEASLRIQEALRLQGQFDVVVAQTDAIAQGASEALSQAGKREETLIVGIGGMRGSMGGIALLQRGVIDAVVRHPFPLEKLYPELQKIAADPNYRPSGTIEVIKADFFTPKTVGGALR
jgi:ABC-type sugar transport system substrate-binding protein